MNNLRTGKPPLTCEGKPVRAVATPRFGIFWAVSLKAAALSDTRGRMEALLRTQFVTSLGKQGRRPIETPTVDWIPCRRWEKARHRDETPLVSDLRPCDPGEHPEWWLLAIAARTVGGRP